MATRQYRLKWLLIFLTICSGLVLLSISVSQGWASGSKSQLHPIETISPDRSQSEEDRQVVRVYYLTQDFLNRIAARIEPWEVNKDLKVAILDVNAEEYDWLIKMGLRVEIDRYRTQQLNAQLIVSPNQISGIPNYSCYKTVEETYTFAESLVASYPHLAEWVDIGDSWKKYQSGSAGYDLYVLRITNQDITSPKPKLFVMASVHAREYAPAGLNADFAEYLLSRYGLDPDVTWLVDYHEIHLLLQANPDGRKYAETGVSWRKNTNENYCSATSYYRGADLNRNFGFKWNYCSVSNYCSSSYSCDITYRGPSAASEPETQAIQNYLRAQFPDQRDDPISSAAPITSTGVFIDLHSYGEQVLWPWGFTTDPTPNGDALQTLGRKFAYFNHYSAQQASVGLYLTDGDSDGFAYGDLGLAGYTFEVGDNFFEPCSYYQSTVLPDNLLALLYAAKIARYPYLLPSGPDISDISVLPLSVTNGDPIQIQAVVNDTRFVIDEAAPEPTQIISDTEFYIDTPPWITAPIPVAYPLNAEDGSYDEKIESVTASIDTTSLSPGKHIIFLHGQDADGNWGPFSAQFFYIYNQQFFLPNISNP